jgi:hypothetical protein
MGLATLLVLALIVVGAVMFFRGRSGGGHQLGGVGEWSGMTVVPRYQAAAEDEARLWLGRLVGSMSTLDASGNAAAAQAYADADERRQAAERQMESAHTTAQYVLVTWTALEGLYNSGLLARRCPLIADLGARCGAAIVLRGHV